LLGRAATSRGRESRQRWAGSRRRTASHGSGIMPVSRIASSTRSRSKPPALACLARLPIQATRVVGMDLAWSGDFRHRRAAMANCLARHAARRVNDPGPAINYHLKPSLVRSAFGSCRTGPIGAHSSCGPQAEVSATQQFSSFSLTRSPRRQWRAVRGSTARRLPRPHRCSRWLAPNYLWVFHFWIAK
jgi:hypothetical protein